MVTEAVVRDYLAEHLDLVESGLTRLETEFQLPNPDGAKGFIDIFARDRYGHLVVIELKISKATSRTALHELYKYIGLLRRQHGVPHHKLRCIVLSTDWRELRVPFSEYASSVDYPVTGKMIVLDDDGVPIRLEEMGVLEEPEELVTSPETLILLYSGPSASERDRCLDELVGHAANLAIADYCLLPIDNPANTSVPFGIYVAIAKLSASDRQRLCGRSDFPIDEYLSEDDEWAYEQAALALLTSDTFCTERETGDPHKLGSVLGEQGWKPGAMRRGGRYQSAALLPDHELLLQLTGLAGESDVWYACFASPRHDASWQHAIQSAQRSLAGNDAWITAFLWFMERTKQEAPTASVAVSLFNPQRTAKILWRLPIDRDLKVLPHLEIVREHEASKRALVLKGEIEWDGTTCPTDPEAVFHRAFEDTFDVPFTPQQFGLVMMTGDIRHMDARIMTAHGLHYALTEHTLEQGKATVRRLVVIDGHVKESTTPGVPFCQFFATNRQYTHDIARMLAPMGYLNLI
jgi:Endonuclease NucS